MIQNDINGLSTQELCDQLSKKTMELLNLIGKKGAHHTTILREKELEAIREKELEVKLIQSAITQKKIGEKQTA